MAFRSRSRGFWRASVAVVLLGWGVTALLVQQQLHTDAALAQARLVDEVRSSTDALAQRMASYAEVVASARDMFIVNPALTHQQFDLVASAHDFRQRYPELRNLSFARLVPAADLPAFEQRLQAQARATGLPEQGIIHPRIERAEHYIIEYLWPLERNAGVWGLDIASQPANLAAVERGRATGETTLSAPFGLLQEVDRPLAVVLRGPVFAGAPAQFIGSVTVTLRLNELLDAVYAQGFLNGVALRLEDVGADTDQQPSAPQFMAEFGHFPSDAQLQQSGVQPIHRALQVQGRRWRLLFVPTRNMLSPSERALPWWLGSGGLVVSLLLGALAHLLLHQRSRALSHADRSLLELQRSEERFRAVFNQAAVGVALTSAHDERFERVNQRYCDIVGYSAPELQARSVRSLVSPEDWPAYQEQLQQLQTGQVGALRLEQRLVQPSGNPIWVDCTLSRIEQGGGEAAFYVSVIQDVTERRRIQEALRASEQRLRAILDHLPVGILLVAQGEEVVFRNRRFVEITGYTEAQLQSTNSWWLRAYPDPGVRERIRSHWQALCAQAPQADGVIAAGEYEIVCADGSKRIVDISGVLQGENHLVIFEDVTAQRAAQEEINYLAHYDALTELPNRQQLLQLLRQVLGGCARLHHSGALLLLDIDHFKNLNETRGHDWGDQLLRQMAERLRGCMHEHASVARHGDDEFVVVLESLEAQPQQAAEQARAEGERILQVLRAPFMLGAEPYHGSVSMGAVVFQGLGDTVTDLLKKADLAMHQAKAAGRDQLQFYDPQVQAVLHERAQLERYLREGLAQGQLALYYQPQMDMAGHIIGCEALLRWRHPQLGFVSPATFIPLAEDTGLILPIGQWVLHTACAQLAAWARQPALAALTLAVNVSARQFHQESFVPGVLAAIASAGANARRLELELTESLLLQDVQDTVAKMVQLKGYGLRFALDDFGTGYSSLAYLKRLPLEQLKIDQGFVRDVLVDPNDAAIARTIVALGSSLGLRVIAEGVETEAQRDFLQRAQCHAWQGYLQSPALPAAEFEALVLAQAPPSNS